MDGAGSEGPTGRGGLREIFIHQWHRPVLNALAGGSRRFVDLVDAVLADHEDAGGDGQITSSLRVLSGFGLVEKAAGGTRALWQLTAAGTDAREALTYMDRLLAEEPRPEAPSPTPDQSHVPHGPGADGKSQQRLAERVAVLNVDVAHPARRYDYWLGGKDNFPEDRRSADEIEALFPGMRAGVRANRQFLGRAVRFLAAERGVRQFLDVGTGLPTAENTHQIAQAVDPSCRIVYVDNDPLVLVHARALLMSTPEGRTSYIDGDVRQPAGILNSPAIAETLDLRQPVALLLVGLLHFIPGEGAASPLVNQLVDVLPSGSFLVVTHVTHDFASSETVAAHKEMQRAGRSDFWMRPKSEVTSLFDGLEILEPGIVPTTKWRPDPDTEDAALNVVNAWAGVGRKGS